MKVIHLVLLGGVIAAGPLAGVAASSREAIAAQGEADVPAAMPQRPIWKVEKGYFLDKRPEWLSEEPDKIRALVREHQAKPGDLIRVAQELTALGRKDSALIVLDGLLATVPENAGLSPAGGRDPINSRLRDAAYAHALCYHLRQSPGDLKEARRLLLAFAQAMPGWPVNLDKGSMAEKSWVAQDHPSVYQRFGSGGLWGRWYHLDLGQSYPLLHAYDLTLTTFSPDERKAIEEGIFDFQFKLIERWPEIYHNTIVYKLEGMIRFGLVLQRPEYIHRAVELIGDLFYIGFSPDGFWSEGTPAYHRQVANRMTGSFPALLEHYCDPPGWHHPETGKRFDDLDLARTFGQVIAEIGRSQEKITLPNGFAAALNDADPDYYFIGPKTRSRPELLGTSGYAVLGSGEGDLQQQLFVNFSGTYGHEHADTNAIAWFALGARVIDETRYRPIPGSDSSRAWSSSTYAHQTVVIDEINQPTRFAKPHREFGPDDAIRGKVKWPLRESHGGSQHMGDLLLFDGSREDLQVVEVEGKKGYGSLADIYRRTIIKVDLGGGEGYLVDFFRVKGGALHDYMLHGPLTQPHQASFSFPLQPASGTLGPKNAYVPDRSKQPRFMDVKESGVPAAPWHVTFATEKNGARMRSRVVHPIGAEVLSGMAPAINHLGDAPFVAVRHRGGESVFVAIHEVYREKPHLRSARLLVEPQTATSGVVLEVDLGEHRHRVFSTFGPDQVVIVTEPGGASTLSGRLGWLQLEGERITRAALWDGTRLAFPGGEVQSPRPAFEGPVVKTLRREAGETGNALIVPGRLPTDGSLAGKTVHVDLGGELTWSYRIEKVEPGDDATSVIHLEHEPGFEIDPNGLSKMLYHPGWGTRQPVTYRIPLSSHSSSRS